jgi:D-arabinose 1-dehydrogenase-like Zn-dependent alcohol dehydrogenase
LDGQIINLHKSIKLLTIFPDIGGFSTHVHAKSDWVFPLPSNIPLELASPLFCAGLTAYNVFSKEFE